MNTLYCPAHITALIHFHCIPEPIRDAPVNDDAIRSFLAAGMIEPVKDRPGQYRTTPLGVACVGALCNMPLPRPHTGFVDSLGNQYGEDGGVVK